MAQKNKLHLPCEIIAELPCLFSCCRTKNLVMSGFRLKNRCSLEMILFSFKNPKRGREFVSNLLMIFKYEGDITKAMTSCFFSEVVCVDGTKWSLKSVSSVFFPVSKYLRLAIFDSSSRLVSFTVLGVAVLLLTSSLKTDGLTLAALIMLPEKDVNE